MGKVGLSRASAFPRRDFASGQCVLRVLPRGRGRRECRVHAAPTALRAKQKVARRPTQVRRNHSGTPCAMALRLLRALPGVPGLLASVANESRRFGRKAETESPFA